MFNSNYPAGAATDRNAPFNRPDSTSFSCSCGNEADDERMDVYDSETPICTECSDAQHDLLEARAIAARRTLKMPERKHVTAMELRIQQLERQLSNAIAQRDNALMLPCSTCLAQMSARIEEETMSEQFLQIVEEDIRKASRA